MDTNSQDPIDTEEQYRVRLVRYMIVGTGHFALFYAVYTYFQGNYFAAVINGFIAVVIGTTLTLIASPHNPYHFLPNMRLQVIVTYAGACLIGFIYESVRNHTLSNLIRQQSLLKESEGRYRVAKEGKCTKRY